MGKSEMSKKLEWLFCVSDFFVFITIVSPFISYDGVRTFIRFIFIGSAVSGDCT